MMDLTFKNKFAPLPIIDVQCAFRQPDDMRFGVYLINRVLNSNWGTMSGQLFIGLAQFH